MPTYAVRLCRNYVRKDSNNTKNITFHRFPTDPVLLERWREVVQRTRCEDYWKPHRSSVVCSDHFSDGDVYVTKKGFRRLKNGSVPSKCLFLSGTKEESSTKTIQDPLASNLKIDAHTESTSCSREVVIVNSETVIQDFSDLYSAYDSPMEAKLRRKLRRKIKLEIKHRQIIKSLRNKLVRLQNRNASYKNIINSLKTNIGDKEVRNVLKENDC